MRAVMTALARHAAARPLNVALSDGRLELSYGPAYDAVIHTAVALRGSGVRTVALALDNGPAWLILDLAALAARHGIAPRAGIDANEIVERCLFPLINEGFSIVEEGIAYRESDVDVVWLAGYGFPAERGGPLFYAETIGLETLLNGMRKYRDLFGPMHWQPAALLEELVRTKIRIAEWERKKHS